MCLPPTCAHCSACPLRRLRDIQEPSGQTCAMFSRMTLIEHVGWNRWSHCGSFQSYPFWDSLLTWGSCFPSACSPGHTTSPSSSVEPKHMELVIFHVFLRNALLSLTLCPHLLHTGAMESPGEGPRGRGLESNEWC